jgi:hypothetical protein
MTLEAGLLLGFIGMVMTTVGLFLAYYYASKNQIKKQKLTTVQKSLRDLLDKNKV